MDHVPSSWTSLTQAVSHRASQGWEWGRSLRSKITPRETLVFKELTEPLLYQEQRDRRLELYNKYPHLSRPRDHAKREIVIITDPLEVINIEEFVRARLLGHRLPPYEAEAGSRSGVLAEDPYFTLIRDPVIFPNGQTGLYNRLINTCSLHGTSGSVALPLTQDGNILLNLIFRHATGEWELELPRGFAKPNEPPVQTVIRELKEETGMDCDPPIPLGSITPDSGAYSAVVPMYLCKTTGQGAVVRGREAISKCIPFSTEEISQGLVDGYLVHNGERIHLRDGFLSSAILQAHLRGHLDLKAVKV